jgi:hypothetical protein
MHPGAEAELSKALPFRPAYLPELLHLADWGTGGTGRYLLRDLTRSGHRVVELARERRDNPAADGIAEVVAESNEVTWVVTGDRAHQIHERESDLPSSGATGTAASRSTPPLGHAENAYPTPIGS